MGICPRKLSRKLISHHLQLRGAPLTFSSCIAISNDRNDQASTLKVSHINVAHFPLVYKFTYVLPLTRIALSPLVCESIH